MALLGSSPLRMESVSISTRASYSPYSAWKCAGLWSLKYIRTTIPKNRVTSGISSLDSTFSARPAPGNLRRPHRPGAAASPAPLGPRLRCDRSEEHTSELQSLRHLVCRLLLEKKKTTKFVQIAEMAARRREQSGARARGLPQGADHFALLRFFFFNDTATTEIYTLSLHDALPIYHRSSEVVCVLGRPPERPRASRF